MQKAPVIYQQRNGVRIPVKGRYVLHGANEVGFVIGRYNHSLPLVIDPTVSYSTYLGGSREDAGNSIKIDSDGSMLITGRTTSPDFPRANGSYAFRGPQDVSDVFITKLDSAGRTRLFDVPGRGRREPSGR